MSETTQAYCVKCKTKREMVNPTPVYTTTGTPGTRGECSVCGTTLFRMGATEAHAALPKPEPSASPSAKKKPGTAKGGKKKPAKKTAVATKKAPAAAAEKAASW